jgi:hypothetical protein
MGERDGGFSEGDSLRGENFVPASCPRPTGRYLKSTCPRGCGLTWRVVAV